MLVPGARTAIIDEGGNAVWEAAGGSRDGKVVFTRRLSAPNCEVGTVQRLYNGNTLYWSDGSLR